MYAVWTGLLQPGLVRVYQSSVSYVQPCDNDGRAPTTPYDHRLSERAL